ncbi:DUF3375 domain-containing protein [Chitinispirillales bacterium ANBcel5]|uniref:DUF3375 domain-containing protein n=1 Tax=Cellulosispirillum alkaliphilum TaxID=3039283 RepID=UPI002A516E34|nr:DUF3375 domain-containing protein [Chitinispirillales bacterium ANBcel5]
MSLAYSDLLQLFKFHPGWRLLRADNAPLILSFLDKTFIEPNVRTISQSDLIARLEDTLYELHQSQNTEHYPRSASAYLEEWAHDSKGWLRKYYPDDSDEPHFDLTPATEKVIGWLESLSGHAFIGTESRLMTIFELLRQMVIGTETDEATRIEALEAEKAHIDRQIEAIRNGEMPLLDETALRERFMQFSTMSNDLRSDFRAVEENFRKLDLQVREKIALFEGSKGELLEEVFGERDAITDSDQGRSFKTFWDFLMSPSSQEEFSELLEKVFSMDCIRISKPDGRLKRIHFDWLEAGEKTQRTVASLSQQLRRYLDNQAYLENKRIMSILDTISQGALKVKHSMPKNRTFMTLDKISPEIQLIMERPLYKPTAKVDLSSVIREANEEVFDSEALFNQIYIDRAELEANIRRELQTVSQITLSALIEKYPLHKGLAELLCYVSIASAGKLSVFDEENEESVCWEDSKGRLRKAMLPRIIFNRS